MMPMKGLLKGLRYISQIFDNEKEEEIQIGFPTDVKHVAHIGMDGPSANTPSWMNKYNANTETSSVSSNGESKHKSTTKSSAQEEPEPPNISEIPKSSSAPLESPTQRSSSKTKHSRRNHSSSSSVGSPGRDSSDLNKPRRQKNSGDISSPRGESSSRGRRPHNLNTGSDSLSENPPKVPKSRRKKSKGSSGSLRSSRSKDPDPLTENFPYSDPGPEPGFTKNEARSNSIYEEGNECDEISRGFRAL